MATIKFYYRSKKNNAPITLRLIHNKEIDLWVNTQKRIDKNIWNIKTGLPKNNSTEGKKTKNILANLEKHTLDAFDNDYANGNEINKDWVVYQIDLFFKRVTKDEAISTSIIDNIERILNTSATRKNGKGGLGLSEGRIKNYKVLKKIVKEFQGRKNLTVKDVNLKFKNDFLTFMNSKKYSESYSIKMLSNIKTVCNDAKINGVEVNQQLEQIKLTKSTNEHIIYLNPTELEQIENTVLSSASLENAKKWLLIGCSIGQRGGDLLKLTDENLVYRNGLNLIELRQEKGHKLTTIPLPQKTIELLKNGFPKKISLQKFNDYIKLVCMEAGLNELTKGKKFNKKTKRKEVGMYKKYELVASHICRRSFCTNLYGKMPTSMIMQISNHATENSFLLYIAKSGLDYAQEIAEYYSKIAQIENNQPQKLTENLKAI